jgi:hypothetical protein
LLLCDKNYEQDRCRLLLPTSRFHYLRDTDSGLLEAGRTTIDRARPIMLKTSLGVFGPSGTSEYLLAVSRLTNGIYISVPVGR